jgi:glyceraldehyde 3-phosphate dehydrogenase
VVKIAINGLGRIGRCVLRAACEYNFDDIEIVALNGPAAIEDHIHLLKYDSVQGIFPHEIKADNDHIVIGNRRMKLTHERDINNLDWSGVDIVLECTGRFNKREEAAKHLARGARKVMVSAPCDGADSTIVFGVNNDALQPENEVISIGSCTTNCLAPVAKIISDNIGISSGFMTTIHSYTGDQNILDGSHRDRRRARAAAVSMVPTSTGAAKALGLVIPELSGKLDGSAVRVPTPNVSLVDLCFMANRETSKQELNELFMQYANGQMHNVLGTSSDKLVSVDFVHNPLSSIVDLDETKIVNNNFCRVVSWYDNEWGFSVRMLDVARLWSKYL